MLAVIREIRLGTQHVGDLLLRARRDGLVVLELGDRGFVRSGDVVVVFEAGVVGHGESFLR